MNNTYLNKNVKFQCQCGNAVWFKPQSGDMKVKINGAEVLLDNCSLSLIGGPKPGQCNLFIDPSTGVPASCAAVSLSGTWNNNVGVNVSGKGVLSSACSIMCPRNGSIKPFKPTILSLNVDDEAKTQSANTATQGEITKNETDIGAADNKQLHNQTLEEASDTNDNIVEVTEKSIDEVEFALCDYKNCDKANKCEYLKTAHTLNETNESKNAADLKTNMGQDSFDLYAGECGAIATSLYDSYMYSIAHHHIVPVNQCFKLFFEIVKLANYYHYNINKAENGICLPTMNIGYDKQPFELRRKIAFNAMEILGKQWHKGGHKYSCKISAEIDSLLPTPFLNYKDAVDKELISYSIKLNEEIKCRTDNYERQAEEFTHIMDHLCEKVAKKLRRFEDDPKKSYPFYISKLAYYYAFQEELDEYEEKLFGKDG